MSKPVNVVFNVSFDFVVSEEEIAKYKKMQSSRHFKEVATWLLRCAELFNEGQADLALEHFRAHNKDTIKSGSDEGIRFIEYTHDDLYFVMHLIAAHQELKALGNAVSASQYAAIFNRVMTSIRYAEINGFKAFSNISASEVKESA